MANITKVYLLNVPLENDYKHTLYFANSSDQQNYFKSRVVKSQENLSYQRKDNFIRYPANYDSLLGCNYVMYQNTNYNNKWFYAFITDMKYVDDGRTDIFIETDCFQTWLFDITVKSSFVEREHASNDTIGAHTVPEQLETGDYIINKSIKNRTLQFVGFLIGSTVDLNDTDASSSSGKTPTYPNNPGGMYNGLYSGVRYYYYATDTAINAKLKSVATKGQSDAITCIFAIPSQFVPTKDGEAETGMEEKTYNWNPGIFGLEQENIYKPSSINGYTPVNKKLLTYPYCYLLMSNNSGGGAVYKYELFKNPNTASLCDFRINFALTPGCSIRAVPLYYNGADANNEEGINLGKYPICNWTTDVYTNWLTQNAVNIPLQFVSGALQVVGGVASMATGAGALAGGTAVASGLMGITSTIGEIYSHSLMPPQTQGNINSGDVTFSQGDLTFTAYQMTIKAEYAKIIDEYFHMFGYKINRVKVPARNHRSRFWFTKTIDVNIDGAIPNKDMQTIKNCYNTGITFWKSASDINNYTDSSGNIVANPIV